MILFQYSETNVMHFLFNVLRINRLTPNDLYRRRTVSPLKIKIPSKKSRHAALPRRDLIPALKG
jgi:hypothetical protein